MKMRLFGSLTSPYVRRARIVASELGVEHTLVDAFTEPGATELMRLSPIWKVPVADIDGTVVIDSGSIVDHMLRAKGAGKLRAPEGAHRVDEENFIHVVNGGLDTAIKLFYLKRDGQTDWSLASLTKDKARIASCMAWLAARVHDGVVLGLPLGFGRAEIALLSALGWYRFRSTFPVDDHPSLVAFERAHEDRPSVKSTIPRAA